MDEGTQERIERTLQESPETHLVAEGSFGMYSADGQSSYRPPEGFADRFGVRVADFSAVTPHDIECGRNVVETPYGQATIQTPCGYAILEPRNDTRSIASLGGDTVAVQTADQRFTWFGFTLSAGFDDVGQPDLVLGLVDDFGVYPAVSVEGDRVVPVVRKSRRGGWLLFVFNLEPQQAHTILRPKWKTNHAHDLLAHRDVPITDDTFQVTIEPWEVAIIHCAEA